jgi:hypothetical protein
VTIIASEHVPDGTLPMFSMSAERPFVHRMLWNIAQLGMQPVQVPGMEEPSEPVIGPIDRAADKCRDVGRSQEAVSSKLAHDNYVVVRDAEGWRFRRRRNRGRRVGAGSVRVSIPTL